jgi:hypothetical protein
MVITMGLGFINSFLVKRTTPRIRLFIGAMIVFILLSATAEFSPELAGGFAILVLVSAFLLEGGGVLNFLMKRGTHDSISGTTTGTPTPPPAKKGGGGSGIHIGGFHFKFPVPPSPVPKTIPGTHLPNLFYYGAIWPGQEVPKILNQVPGWVGTGAAPLPPNIGVQHPGAVK